MRSLETRLGKLEAILGARGCDCINRPAVAVTYEDPARWETRRVVHFDAKELIQRETEEAKLNWACPTHGNLGPGIHVQLRSFGSYPNDPAH